MLSFAGKSNQRGPKLLGVSAERVLYLCVGYPPKPPMQHCLCPELRNQIPFIPCFRIQSGPRFATNIVPNLRQMLMSDLDTTTKVTCFSSSSGSSLSRAALSPQEAGCARLCRNNATLWLLRPPTFLLPLLRHCPSANVERDNLRLPSIGPICCNYYDRSLVLHLLFDPKSPHSQIIRHLLPLSPRSCVWSP
jgi:hypothetical protein